MIYLKQLWGFLRSVPAWAYAVLGWGVAYLTAVSLRKERAQVATVKKKAALEDTKRDAIELAEKEAVQKREMLLAEHEDTMSLIDQQQRDIDRAKSLEDIADIINAMADE